MITPGTSQILWLLTCVVAAPSAQANSVAFEGGFPTTTKNKIYPLSKVKRGDIAVGYTVLTEDKITTFKVEILGVLRAMLGPGKDVILARLSGPEIQFTGVISGMSGSPVYIDGRLLGAVSYRFGSFSKEPIAGITPIASMLAIHSDEVSRPPDRKRRRAQQLGLDPAGRGSDRLGVLPSPRPIQGSYDPIPIDTPLMIGGLHPQVSQLFRKQLKDAGFTSMAGSVPPGPAARMSPNQRAQVAASVYAAPIAPGAPIAAVLMSGDIWIAATGTVTLVEDGRVLAFGHPFMGAGHVAFPMATSAILNTLASAAGSYKQGAPARIVGAITHDRLTAIAGTIGASAPTIPVSIRLHRSDRPTKAEHTNVRIVESETWFPVLFQNALLSSAARRLGHEAGGSVDFEARIHVGDRTLEIRDSYSAPAPKTTAAFVASDLGATISQILQNEIEQAKVRGVEVSLVVSPEVALAYVETVIADADVVAPGTVLGLSVTLRSFRGQRRQVRLSLPIPRDARGKVEVVIGGALELDRRDATVYGPRIPAQLDDLLGILAERRHARGLYAGAFLPRPGLRANAELLSALPLSQRVTLSVPGQLQTQAVKESFGPRVQFRTPEIIVGSAALSVIVSN